MTEREQQRLVNHRLAVIRHAEEVTGSVAQTCRYCGITRQTFYRWLRRYEEKGVEGLRDRSSRPHHCPHETSAEVVGKIIYLRQNYHFGPAKISMYLKRYHDIEVSTSGVWRILKRLELTGCPARNATRPTRSGGNGMRNPSLVTGSRWTSSSSPLSAGRGNGSTSSLLSTTAPDYESSGCIRDAQKTAIQFLDYLLQKLPFRVEVIQTDNGAEFGSQFHVHVLDRGIRHVYIKPATPRLNGKVDRSHRIDEEEFYRMLDGIVIDDTELFDDKLQEWEDFYNFNRPHGALDGQTPYERLRQKTAQNPSV